MRGTALVWLCLGLAAGPVSAQDTYAELQVGSSNFEEADIDISGFGSGNLKYDPGFTIGGALGTRVLDGMLRLEASVSYRQSDINELDTGSASTGGDGTLGVTAALGNAYFDIPVDFPVKPYIGGGIGAVIFTPDANSSEVEVNGPDARFGGDLMAGAFWSMTENLELDLRYRWLTSMDAKLDAEVRGSAADNGLELGFSAHEVVAALRILF